MLERVEIREPIGEQISIRGGHASAVVSIRATGSRVFPSYTRACTWILLRCTCVRVCGCAAECTSLVNLCYRDRFSHDSVLESTRRGDERPPTRRLFFFFSVDVVVVVAVVSVVFVVVFVVFVLFFVLASCFRLSSSRQLLRPLFLTPARSPQTIYLWLNENGDGPVTALRWKCTFCHLLSLLCHTRLSSLC